MPTGIYKRTKPAWNKGLKGFTAGNKHYRWLGCKVSYRGIHKWIEKQLGKPRYCEHCKNSKLKHRQYNWANKKPYLYKRKLTDWIRLCVSCHKKYDKK